jgi:multicomponent Na+:H+ antiporter subunit C
MELILAVIVGVLFACGVYALLRRSMVRLVIGLVLISQAANLLIITAAGLTRDEPPIVDGETDALALAEQAAVADPLPQALVLTAIVISFGVVAFALVLVRRAFQTLGTDDLDEIPSTDVSEP